MTFDEQYDVKEVIKNILLKRVSDIEKYVFTIKKIHNINVVQDKLYQKTFNGFYRIRQRSAEWYKNYYDIFEKAKTSSYSFEDIITALYKRTDRVEASFTSKMVATLNPNMPIWDKFVLQNLNMKLEGTSKQIRLKNAITLYYKIVEWYQNFLNTVEAHKWVKEFDLYLSEYSWLTPTKKIDFIMWSMRDSKN